MIESRIDAILEEIKKDYKKYMSIVSSLYVKNQFKPKQEWSLEDKKELDFHVEIKNIFARLEIDTNSLKSFLDSLRCDDSQHQWKPLLFNSVCQKCGVVCRHDPKQTGKCSICLVAFEDGVAPFDMSSIKQD